MPYCTIEEAWSNSLTQEQLQPYNEKELDLKLKKSKIKTGQELIIDYLDMVDQKLD